MITQLGNHFLILGNMLEELPKLEHFDAIVTDPPYGIKEAAGKNKSRGKQFGKKGNRSSALAISRDYGNETWDNEPCSPEQIALMRDKSDYQIIFGGNYFQLPPSSCWLVWDKMNGESDFADAELAWTNMKKAVRLIQFRWNGMLRDNGEKRGDHPTQKPIGVMTWCLKQLPQGCRMICDPFMGSGTTGVACHRRGLTFVGIEQNETYYRAAVRRITEELGRTVMFDRSELPARELFA